MMAQSVVFDRAAEFYDETRGFPAGIEQAVAEMIAKTGGLTPNSTVLEIGVGTGRIALPLARHVRAYHGLDLSRAMMMRLKAKQTDEPISVVQGDATQLPYASHSLDAVIAVHVFHLIPNWRGVISELERVLKPGAPVIHCWSEHDDVFRLLWNGWRNAVPNNEATDVGLRWERNEDFLTELGWTEGTKQVFTYRYHRAPADFINQLRNRIWSHTWHLSDATLSAGIQAIEAIAAQQFNDPTQPVEVEAHLIAKAYIPPKQT